MKLATLDLAIIGATFAAVLIGGFAAGRDVRDADSYCLGTRRAPWWAVGLSVFATYVSALSFLGAPGWAYEDGLRTLMLQANFPLVVLIVARVFVPMFFALRLASIYEYHRERFGNGVRRLSSGLYLLTQTLSTAGILYTSALVLGEVLGLRFEVALVGVGAITVLYSAGGGMNSVLWTDVVQAAVLLVGLALVFAFAVGDALALNTTPLLAADPERYRIVVWSPDLTDKYAIWAGLIAMTIYRVQAQGASQFVIQRTLAARSLADAQRSLMVIGYVAVPTLAAMLIIGACLYLIYDGESFANANTIVLHYLADLAIPGLGGIVVAALFAASMSSVDSSLNSLATVTFHGFLKRGEGGEPGRDLFTLRLLSTGWLALLLVPAYLFSRGQGSILERVVELGSYFAGAELALFCLGFFCLGIGQAHALLGVAGGFLSVLAVAVLTPLSWPWYCAVGFLGTCGGAYLARAFSGPARLTREQTRCLYVNAVPTSLSARASSGERLMLAYLLGWLALLSVTEWLLT